MKDEGWNNLFRLPPSSFRLQRGCRGFTGPVPPPLWMRFYSLNMLVYQALLRTSMRRIKQPPNIRTNIERLPISVNLIGG